MADVNGAQKLKRKREGAEPQRKKAKTQGKGKSKAEVEAVEISTPEQAAAKPVPSNSTPTPKSKKGLPTPQKSQTNGTHADPASGTPSSSRKPKNKPKSGRISGSDAKQAEVKAEKQEDAVVDKKIEEELHVQQPQKKKRRKDKGQRNADTILENAGTEVHTNGPQPSATNTGAADRPSKKDKKQKKHKRKTSDDWSISPPQGGWFLPQDPVFSPDEAYLLLAKLKAVEVYSTETSLLARELPVGGSGVILAYALSSAQANYVYIADSTGIITLWNWTDGSKIGRWDIGANVRHLLVVQEPNASQDLLYSHEVGDSHVVNVHALRTKDQASKPEVKRILKTKKPITGMQVLLQGKIVIISLSHSIMIGKRIKLHKTELQDFEYTWRELETTKRITTQSAYVRVPDADKSKSVQESPRDHLDLAIGDEEGVMFLFEDIVSSFAAIERSQKDKSTNRVGLESLRPKRLDWHRDAVGAVKWSSDGNYLISGGDETVLVIWQLSTGKQQHLPHLTAAIENLVVSPSGSSYGARLANNSVIVLSTSELKAKTNIVGVQSRRIDVERLPRDSNSQNYSYQIFQAVPMGIDPKNSSRLIFATPSSQPRHQRGRFDEPYAQTFDIANRRSIARQALTRNAATDPNIGPEGRKILEPSVKFLQPSHDGAWLATVDEWTPPQADTSFIEEGIPTINGEERTFRREVYLKIWQWDEKGAQWILNGRIDAPHFFENVSAHAAVLDLVADPSGSGFATVGEDRSVRIWRPKTRTRDGLVVRGADRSQGLVTWCLDRSVRIASKLDITGSNQDASDSSVPQACRLAFSADGSVLTAGVSWSSLAESGVVHIIATDEGKIRRSITEVDVASLSGLGIIGRYLIAVGESVSVWDMVTDQLAYCVPIDTSGLDSVNRVGLVRLATNEEEGTFAVAAPQFNKNETSKSRDSRRSLKASTEISIFRPESPKPRWIRTIPGVVLGLVPAKGKGGYVMLDGSSSVRVIDPRTAILQLPTPPPEPVPALLASYADVDEEDGEDAEKSKKHTSDLQLDASDELLRNSENDKPVVRPEQLQQIFESGPSHALPPVTDLFNAVVGLYARKPRPAIAAGGE